MKPKLQVTIMPVTKRDFPEWLAQRSKLWPKESRAALRRDLPKILAHRRETAFVARAGNHVAGFIEVRLRDVAEGARTSPVGYIEAWFVLPKYRKQGVGRALVKAGETWAKQQGVTEMGSDTWVNSTQSHRAHTRVGYKEVERLIAYYKKLK